VQVDDRRARRNRLAAIVGNRANPNTAEAALALLVSGRVDLTPLMTHRFPLSAFPRALEVFERREDGAVKVAIKP
jgi:L-iditol 2-dehydrogenase